ncbi:transcription elongation factor A protein-like 7 isoform X3 [Panthera pardus]|uniref:Transcription elongation factor A protein-like 7 isoform X3 n=1 Tax=Panthera pardus TaxID=9691 RepID=A0A9W2UMD6_PANPR|nr:transcription elongation factor A protein-like 7 isoform X3 [Panthera pardus]
MTRSCREVLIFTGFFLLWVPVPYCPVGVCACGQEKEDLNSLNLRRSTGLRSLTSGGKKKRKLSLIFIGLLFLALHKARRGKEETVRISTDEAGTRLSFADDQAVLDILTWRMTTVPIAERDRA